MDFQYITAVFNGYYTVITEQIEQFSPEVHIRIMDLEVPRYLVEPIRNNVGKPIYG